MVEPLTRILVFFRERFRRRLPQAPIGEHFPPPSLLVDLWPRCARRKASDRNLQRPHRRPRQRPFEVAAAPTRWPQPRGGRSAQPRDIPPPVAVVGHGDIGRPPAAPSPAARAWGRFRIQPQFQASYLNSPIEVVRDEAMLWRKDGLMISATSVIMLVLLATMPSARRSALSSA